MATIYKNVLEESTLWNQCGTRAMTKKTKNHVDATAAMRHWNDETDMWTDAQTVFRVSAIPRPFLKQNPSCPTGPVSVWHACCFCLPLGCKCWVYGAGHWGGPPNKPPLAYESSHRTVSNWSSNKKYWANNLWLMWCFFEMKMILRVGQTIQWDIFVVKLPMCTVFHALNGAWKSLWMILPSLAQCIKISEISVFPDIYFP